MARILVMHESHGCETGCCGHIIYIDDEKETNFQFDHPDGPPQEWTRQIIEEMGCDPSDLDWEHSVVVPLKECGPNW